MPKYHLVAEVLEIRSSKFESLLIYQGRVNSGYAAALRCVHYGRCGFFVFDAVPPRLRNLTPAPPPFSSMNSTPAACSALCIFSLFHFGRQADHRSLPAVLSPRAAKAKFNGAGR